MAFSSSVASFIARRKNASSLRSSASPAERRSTSIAACEGIAFTLVPPSMLPTLKVVRGSFGAGYAASREIARPSA